MWILSGDSTELVNLDHVERIFTAQLNDETFGVTATFNRDKEVRDKAICGMGKYESMVTAKQILCEIGQAILDQRDYFIMPEVRYDKPQPHIQDARTKRRGGS